MFLAVVLFLSLTGSLHSLERKLIAVEALPGKSEYVATGFVPFPQGTISATDKIRIIDALGKQEVPSSIMEEDRWPDGSLMLVKIGFLVTSDGWKTQQYYLEWGDEISRSRAKLDEGLPTTTFRVLEGLPDETLDYLNVGTLIVRVEENTAVTYYWYLVPIAVLLSALVLRKFRLNRQ